MQSAKEKMVTLAYILYDPNIPIPLKHDASEEGLGATLEQKDG